MYRHLLFVMGLLVGWTVLPVGVDAQSPRMNHRAETVVLLTNGQLIVGQVLRTDSSYKVELPSGATVVLPAAQVELHCQTKQEAFEHVLINSDPFSLAEQSAVVEWCLRNELFVLAEQQIRQLELMGAPSHTIRHLRSDLDRRLNLKHSSPTPAGTAPRPELDNVQSQEDSLSTLELKAWIEQLPDSVYTTYATRVQSRLIYGCAAAQCHHQRAEVMPLFYDMKGKPVPRLMTERNLYTVMQFVDVESPFDSPILTRAKQAHGGADSPAWETDSQELELLIGWLAEVSESHGNSPPRNQTRDLAVRIPRPEPGAGAIGSHDGIPGQSQLDRSQPMTRTPPTSWQPGSEAGRGASRATGSHAASVGSPLADLPAPPSPVNPLERTRFRPVDPFDPEIFNRRYSRLD